MAKTAPIISLANVHKRFGNIDAVNDISAVIGAGEVVGFIGPNGAGKSTTISLLMGYARPTKGTVRLFSQAVEPATVHKLQSRIGYASGDMHLPEHLTGDQYLRFIVKKQPRDPEVFQKVCRRLSPQLDRPIGKLSRGNKQKIALIAALQHQPELLILDEPTSGLDPLIQQAFLQVIAEQASRGMTVLMSSHVLGEVADICSRVLFIRAGKFILDKSTQEVLGGHGKHALIKTDSVDRLKATLPNDVTIIEVSSEEIRVGFETANLQSFLRWLSTKRISDVTIENRELDDIFRDLYEPARRKRS